VVAAYVASDGFRVSPLGDGVPLTMGPFVVSAVPAHDGWGEWQVSYVIDVGSRRFFHGGDTLWHGKWWDYGRLFGPFDVAFLPINGAIIPPRTGDVRIPHTLTAEQAVIAAKALQAHTMVPMHYGVHDPGRHEQEPDLLSRAATLAVRAGIGFHAAAGGALVPLPTPASR
jgi:L-ascorbate metabolism protein UlaG (beta-lactamase superfamily)